MTRAAGLRLRRKHAESAGAKARRGLLSRILRASRHKLSSFKHLDTTVMRMSVAAWEAHQRARFAVIADLHVSPEMGDYLDDIVEQVLSMKPDAILFLGDLMNGHSDLESMPLERIAKHLKPWSALPLYGVLGNHDYWYDEKAVRAMLERELGMHLMEGRSHCLELTDDTRVYFGGIRCLYTFQKDVGKLPRIPHEARRQGDPFIVLSHTPSGAFHAPEGTLITVAGHSHGGQICLPRGGVLASSEPRVPRELSRGYHEKVEGVRSALYTSRGLGTSVVPLRLFCPPEIFLLELEGGELK